MTFLTSAEFRRTRRYTRRFLRRQEKERATYLECVQALEEEAARHQFGKELGEWGIRAADALIAELDPEHDKAVLLKVVLRQGWRRRVYRLLGWIVNHSAGKTVFIGRDGRVYIGETDPRIGTADFHTVRPVSEKESPYVSWFIDQLWHIADGRHERYPRPR